VLFAQAALKAQESFCDKKIFWRPLFSADTYLLIRN
jgi:hypothetical protein